ncbi:GTPase family protein [Phascolarctobacterium sp.]|uniref:GTPase family protein n=1 Tax=Phascolarctobacterium sp. TaxID=2049039 RepID=UPI003869D488
MKDEYTVVEERLQNLKNFYKQTVKLIEELPDIIPKDVKKLLKSTILDDEELKNIMDGIDKHRPPRILLMGRTGVGKSSLVNALCGAYVAKVSDTRSCTESAQAYQCKHGDRVLMDVYDTRGIAESKKLDESITAEDVLVQQIRKFSPDLTIFMLNCTRRDDISEDVEFLKKLNNDYQAKNKLALPIIVAINKSDEMAPSRQKDPNEYSAKKIEKITEMKQYYKEIINENGLEIADTHIIAVSSLIEWARSDGREIDVDEISELSTSDVENLQISFDGRYQIDKLHDILLENLNSYEARMGLMMAIRLNDFVHKLADRLNNIFATLAGCIALSPIPLSDIYILLLLQSLLVATIASLSGRNLSIETAMEFIFSLVGMTGVGFALKLLAQQASKIFPGVGSAVSAFIAKNGTLAIGEAAIAYYIDDEPIKIAKEKFEKTKSENLTSQAE